MAATIASIAASGVSLTTAMGGVAVVALIMFLIQRELASVAGPRFRPLNRALMVIIAPLLVVFITIVVSRLASLV